MTVLTESVAEDLIRYGIPSAACAIPMPRNLFRGPRMVALGDSITVGVGDDAGWAKHLASLLGAELVNLACNGARARDVAKSQLDQAVSLRPELVTIFVGGNDTLRGDFDADDVADQLRVTVARLQAVGACVLLVAPPRMVGTFPVPARVRAVMETRMARTRAAVLSVAVAAGRADRLVLLDSQVMLANVGLHTLHIDRIHPSPLGHRILAGLAAERLAGEGWAVPGALDPAPAPPPLWKRVAWLLFKGAPWVAKRSRDLLPELIAAIWRDLRAEKVGGRPATLPERRSRSALAATPVE